MTRRNPFIGGEGEDDGTSAGEPPTDRPPVSGEPHPECIEAYHRELLLTGRTIMSVARVRADVAAAEQVRPPVSGEPSTKSWKKYLHELQDGGHLTEFGRGFLAAIEAEARVTPSLDRRLADFERRLMVVLKHGHDLEKPGVRTALWIVSEVWPEYDRPTEESSHD